MDFDLASLSAADPMMRQRTLAEYLRNSKRAADQEALAAATAQTRQFDPMAAIAPMLNNPGAVKSALIAQKNAQGSAPVQLGNTGFMIPTTGQFVESPMYADEKQASREATATNLQTRLAATASEGAERRALTLAIAKLNEEGRNDRAAQANALRETIASLAAGRAAEKAAEKDADKAKGKNLSASEVRKLSDRGGVAVSFSELVGSFKPEYGGQGMESVASAQNILGKYQPLGMGEKYADQSNWWQNYNDQKNLVRHTLFGSALTKPEQEAFDRANIKEGMSSDEISRRLSQQHRAAVRAYNKLKASYGQAGYNVSEMGDLVEPADVPMPGAPAKPVAAPTAAKPKFRVLGVEK